MRADIPSLRNLSYLGSVTVAGEYLMADEIDKPRLVDGPLIQRLIKETGISEAQARELVSLLGLNWASLMREARFLRQKL